MEFNRSIWAFLTGASIKDRIAQEAIFAKYGALDMVQCANGPHLPLVDVHRR